jgi:APA family basic amino acid/polyamine antiporter
VSANGFVRELSLLDCTMIVAGSMIGSGIFIVSADISRLVGAPGWLLVAWAVTGLLTVAAALSYGELASMMPEAGGQYVYLREAYSPLWGFLYGWALFLVIQTGTVAAVAVAFARFLGVLVPWISPERWIVPPVHLSSGYAVSLSSQQLVGILSILLLTWTNTRGIRLGKLIQNSMTAIKTVSLLAVIVLGLLVGRNAEAIAANFGDFWGTARAATAVKSDFSFVPAVSAAGGAFGLFVAFCVAQVGSLFSSDAWNNVGFAAGEVKDPRRTVPLAMAAGTALVTLLYFLANLSYVAVLPIGAIQAAPDDRVGTAFLGVLFGPWGATIMAAAIVISTFGCNNGLILAGARVYYAMARDRLFFRPVGKLNARHVPAVGLWWQGIWASLLILPRTRLGAGEGGAERYGNLYGNLLDYVVFAVLIFYALTLVGLFVLRRRRPDAPRPYRAFGYPVVPVLYLAAAAAILAVLLAYRSQTTWPGLLIVVSGVPVYFLWRRARR